MSEYSDEHHKHHEKGDHYHSHHSSHGNHHDHEDHYRNYGIDYGERARRIIEASNRGASAFKPVEHGYHFAKISMNDNGHGRDSNKLQPEDFGTDRLHRRRHSMFEDTTNVRLHRDNTSIHNIKEMHLDDIVLAYTKKYPNDRTIGHTAHNHFNRHHETHEQSRTRPVEASKQPDYNHHTITDKEIRTRSDDKHRLEQSHFVEIPSKSWAILKGDHSAGSYNSRDHVSFEKSGASEIGARIELRSPTVDEAHHVNMSRANEYKHELSSPEIERLRAYRDRESNARAMERHALAQVITEGCRRRHECEGHGHHGRHYGHDARHNDNSGMPEAGKRRHTLASTTGKEWEHRHRHSRKNRDTTFTTNEPLRGNEGIDINRRHSTHGEKHASHDDVSWVHARHHSDFLMAPQTTERRHSWTNITHTH